MRKTSKEKVMKARGAENIHEIIARNVEGGRIPFRVKGYTMVDFWYVVEETLFIKKNNYFKVNIEF